MDSRRVNIDSFVTLMKNCHGRIFLKTEDDEQLIVDSFLSAIVGFQNLMRFTEQADISIQCELPEDQQQIDLFLVESKVLA